MRQAAQRLYYGFPRIKLAMVLLAGLFYVAVTVLSGGSAGQLVLFALVLLGWLVLPGVLVASLLRGRGLPDALFGPVAALCGAAVLCLCCCAAMLSGWLWLLYLLPPALGLFLVLAACLPPLRRRLPVGLEKRLPTLRPAWPSVQPRQWLFVLLFAGLMVIFALSGVAEYARPSAAGAILPSQDLLWNVGNANSFRLGFPPEDIRFAGITLRYHYLTELVAGALAIVSGIPAYNILAFYLPPFVLGALLLGLYRFGLVAFEGKARKAGLFAFSFFTFNCASLWRIFDAGRSIYWNSTVTHLITNINSQATATLCLCVFCGVFVALSRAKYRGGAGAWVAAGLSFLMLSLSKGPVAALVACALVLTVIIGLFQRKTGWRGLLFGALAGGIFLGVYALMYTGGTGSSTRLNPLGTMELSVFWQYLVPLLERGSSLLWPAVAGFAVLHSFLAMPGQFFLYIYGLFGDIRRFFRLTPERLLYNGVAVGGLVAYYLFSHKGFSQMYFMLGAMFFISLLAVDAAGRLFPALDGPKPAFAAPPAGDEAGENLPPKGVKKALRRGVQITAAGCALVGLLSSGCLYAYMAGSGTKQLARNQGLLAKPEFSFHPATPDDEAAALWLRDNTPKDAVFATNRVYHAYVSQFFSAFGERQGYMEGYHYTNTNMGVGDALIHSRWAVLEALFSAETPQGELAALAQREGIGYIVYVDVENDVGTGENQLAGLEQVFSSESVRIYRVP